MDNLSLYFKETPFGQFCLVEKDLISNFINDRGYWELHLYDLYSKLITPDSVVVDGGANIGFHTIQFAKLAFKGKVYSFEPQSFIFNVLSTNALINGLSHVISQYRLGLSDGVSKQILTSMENPGVAMTEFCINWGGRGFTEEDGDEEATTIALDSFELPKLDFIKLDIQGFEYRALKGGEKTIRKNMPIVFIENYDGIYDGTDEKIINREKDAINFLLELGYTGYRLLVGNKEDCIFTTDGKRIESLLGENGFNFELIK